MKKERLSPEVRSAQLLDVALHLAAVGGLTKLTRQAIADSAGLKSPGIVTHRLGTMHAMRRSVIRAAIDRRNLKVLAEALVLKDPHALKAPAELRLEALRSLANG